MRRYAAIKGSSVFGKSGRELAGLVREGKAGLPHPVCPITKHFPNGLRFYSKIEV